MPHQEEMFWHQITRIQALISGEMGVGKTLSMIEALEYSRYSSIIWVGTGSSIAAVKLEFRKWKSNIINNVLFITYHSFRDAVKNNDLFVPEAIVFDEAQKLKSPQTIQSQMAGRLTEAMRSKLKDEAFINLMSGAPAPKSPADWWHICEVACPGFLREGDWWKFRDRLAILSEQTSASNQVYYKIETWLDDSEKCAICGKLEDEHIDDLASPHDYRKSKNEVEYLYQRMNGLNIVFFKKDCLAHLPELQFRLIKLEPSDLIKKAEQMIIKTTPRTVTALMKLRELSDGFQYKETETGETESCPLCQGSCTTAEWYDPEYPDEAVTEQTLESGRCKSRTVTCTHCDGEGFVGKLNRIASTIACPKEQLLKDLLEEHEDIGRFVVYAGFQASVDRVASICLQQKWNIIQADGRGWKYFNATNAAQTTGVSREDMLELFQNAKFTPKLCFIGQAGAAGTGLTLTASPSVFCYSNSFNADDRIQLINRIHRPGMDINKGATVIDCVHLDTDQYVLDNLSKKLDLLAMSMGKFRKAVKDYEGIRRDDYVTV
jgi:SNF2 family DNA or RNA helicase